MGKATDAFRTLTKNSDLCYIKLQQAEGWEEETREANQLAPVGRNRPKTAHIAECMLRFLINFQVAVSTITWREQLSNRPGDHQASRRLAHA